MWTIIFYISIIKQNWIAIDGENGCFRKEKKNDKTLVVVY